jgi:hypothetical protein
MGTDNLTMTEIALWKIDIAERFRSPRLGERMTDEDQRVYSKQVDRQIFPRLQRLGLIRWDGMFILTEKGSAQLSVARKRTP